MHAGKKLSVGWSGMGVALFDSLRSSEMPMRYTLRNNCYCVI